MKPKPLIIFVSAIVLALLLTAIPNLARARTQQPAPLEQSIPAPTVSQDVITVTKSVTPTSSVEYGDLLTYTLVISAEPGTQINLYDPLTQTNFLHFAPPIAGITCTHETITGTLTVTPSNQISVSFVVQVAAPGSTGWTMDLVNRACIYPFDGSLGGCIWSNPVTNSVFRPYMLYLPIVHGANRPPNVPSDPSPPAGAVDQPLNLDLSWTGGDPGGGPVTYDVYLEFRDSTPDVLVCDDVNTATCGAGTVGTLYEGAHYYWQVIATNDKGLTSAGPVWDLRTQGGETFYDDFSDDSSGWLEEEGLGDPDMDSYYRLRYEQDQYRITIDLGGPNIWRYQPDSLAPYNLYTDHYCVETKARFMRGQPPYQDQDYYPFWGNMGLIFGASEDNTDLYAVCLSVGGYSDVLGWMLIHNPEYTYPRVGCGYTDGMIDSELAPAQGVIIDDWTVIQAQVEGDQVTIYMNGIEKGDWTIEGLGETHFVGVVAGDVEITPLDVRYEYFRVIPNAACEPYSP